MRVYRRHAALYKHFRSRYLSTSSLFQQTDPPEGNACPLLVRVPAPASSTNVVGSVFSLIMYICSALLKKIIIISICWKIVLAIVENPFLSCVLTQRERWGFFIPLVQCFARPCGPASPATPCWPHLPRLERPTSPQRDLLVVVAVPGSIKFPLASGLN